MAAAIQLGMAASSFLCPSRSFQVAPTTSCSPAKLPVVSACQRNNLERNTVSRRFWAVGAASSSAIAVSLLTQPEGAEAARRKPPPAEEKKRPAEQEDKSLSKNEKMAIANARRKEAMKASIDAAKAKASSISSPDQ